MEDLAYDNLTCEQLGESAGCFTRELYSFGDEPSILTPDEWYGAFHDPSSARWEAMGDAYENGHVDRIYSTGYPGMPCRMVCLGGTVNKTERNLGQWLSGVNYWIDGSSLVLSAAGLLPDSVDKNIPEIVEDVSNVSSTSTVMISDLLLDRTGYDPNLGVLVIGGDTVADFGFTIGGTAVDKLLTTIGVPSSITDAALNTLEISYNSARNSGAIESWEVQIAFQPTPYPMNSGLIAWPAWERTGRQGQCTFIMCSVLHSD